MWTYSDIDHWLSLLFAARDLGYVEARKKLLQLRDEVGEATITEAHKQKRQRYLDRRARRESAHAAPGQE